MKRIYIIAGVVLMAMLALALCVQAVAETYPIYEVIVRPALLRKTPALSTVSPTEDPLVICTVPINSKVLVAAEKDGWCLVYTQEKLTGYICADLCARSAGISYEPMEAGRCIHRFRQWKKRGESRGVPTYA